MNGNTASEAIRLTGTVVGYDPGGNCKHGFATGTVREGALVSVSTKTLRHAEEVVASILDIETLLGLGIDTLTCWGTGHSGWRPADRWLRKQYPEVQQRILAPNGLYGAMSVNGMAVLVAVRRACPGIFITETHPKVLYHALFKQPYHFDGPTKSEMSENLNQLLAVKENVAPQNEHEWDAAISIHAVVNGLKGSWQRDLHALSTNCHERLVQPCGTTEYLWPESNFRRVIRPATAIAREVRRAD